MASTDDEINTSLSKFCQISDISYKNKGVFAKEEMVASAGVSRSLKFKEGKYEVAILWKNDRTLPSNYNAAFKRLDNIENRLIRQPKLDGKYFKIIEDYINKGYLEYLDNKERTDNGWFLPYFLSIPIS